MFTYSELNSKKFANAMDVVGGSTTRIGTVKHGYSPLMRSVPFATPTLQISNGTSYP